MASAAFTASTIFTAVDKFTAPVRQMETATKSFAKSSEVYLSKAERGFRKLTTPLRSLNNMLGGFGIAIGGALLLNNVTTTLKDYEDAIASAMAITGKMNTEAFAPYKKQIELVADSTKKSTIDIAKGFEIVGSAKPELLANAEALGVVTKAAITLSKASGDDLQTSAMSLTGVMNQFNLAADQSERTMNTLAAGSVVGSANITQVSEAMKNFGSVASSSNLSLEESVALVEVLGKFSVFGAEAGTKLRGSVLQLQKANLGYASGQFNTNDALLEAKKKMDLLGSAAQKDAYLIKLFGSENVSTGKILLGNIGLFNEYTKGVTGTNTAVEQAEVKSRTFSNRLAELQNKWTNLITSNEAASGSFSMITDLIVYLTDNLDTVIKTVVVLAGTILAIKGILMAWRGVMSLINAIQIAHNVILGISIALQKKSALALVGNTIGYKAYLVAMKIATAAQWLLNAAMSANPIGLVIIGIAALIALVVVIIKYWDEWGAALAFFTGPLGLIISLFMTFKKNWDLIKKSFEVNGIIGGLKSIGITILDAFLMPIQQLLELIGQLPDWLGGGLAVDASASIQKLRDGLQIGLEETAGERGVVNINNERQKNLVETVNSNQKQSLDVNFNNAPEGTKLTGSGGFAVPKIAPSFNFGS